MYIYIERERVNRGFLEAFYRVNRGFLECARGCSFVWSVAAVPLYRAWRLLVDLFDEGGCCRAWPAAAVERGVGMACRGWRVEGGV